MSWAAAFAIVGVAAAIAAIFWSFAFTAARHPNLAQRPVTPGDGAPRLGIVPGHAPPGSNAGVQTGRHARHPDTPTTTKFL